MIQSSTSGWAIRWIYTDIDGSVRRAFLGKYFWIDGVPATTPDHMDGYTTMVYKTRALARQALSEYKARHNHSEWFRKTYRRLTVAAIEVTVHDGHDHG